MVDPAQLLVAIQAGDRAAFDCLVRTQTKHLYALAYRVTGDSDLADDVVQETFLRILERRSPFRQEGPAEAWLARVTTRLAIDQMRRRAARRSREEKHAMARERDKDQSGENLLAEAQASLLSDALASLSVETRAALWLHLVEGSGVREVAVCLGSTRSTVNRRIQSGLRELRDFLERRGWVLPVALPLGKLLQDLPTPGPSLKLMAYLEGLGDSLSTTGNPVPGSSAGRAKVGSKASTAAAMARALLRTARSPDAVLPAACALLLVIGGLAIWVLDPFGWKEREAPSRNLAGVKAPAVLGKAEPQKREQTLQPSTQAALKEPRSPFEINGRVVDEQGQPVAQVDVVAFEDFARRDLHDLLDRWGFVDLAAEALTGPSLLGEAKTDAEGHFTLALSQKPDLVLCSFAGRAGSGTTASLSGTARVTAESDWAEIVLKPAVKVAGTVRDLEGAPMEGTRLVVIPNPAMPNDRDFTSFDFKGLLNKLVPLSTTADNAGRFEFAALPVEEKKQCQILAIRDGYAAEHVRVDLSRTGEVEIVLRQSSKIPGRVVHSPGAVPGAGARILALGPFAEERGWFATAITGDNGAFVLDGSLEGGFEVFTKLPGYIRPKRIHWEKEKNNLPLNIEFDADGAIQGTVRFERTGQPASGVRILCRDLEGALMSAEALTDEDGRYRLPGVPLEFHYDLFVALPGFIPKEPLTKPPTAEEPQASYDIDLVPTAVVRGRVVGPTGAGVPNAAVEVMATAESPREGVNLRLRTEILAKEPLKTDESGAFVAEDVVPRGKVFVWAYDAALGEAFMGPLTFSEGEPSVGDVTVQLQGAGLEVGVTDTLGQLLDAVEVRALSETLYNWVPKGMALKDWYNERTSMDLSRYGLQLKMVPGSRLCMQGKDTLCTWTDLTAAPYVVTMSHDFIPGNLPTWDCEYWLYLGTTEALSPHQVLRLRLPLNLSRSFVGRVTDKEGKILSPIRVQVWYTPDPIPGLTRLRGYSVTHTREDGSFRAEGVGPGPYRITVQDRANRVIEVKDVPEAFPDLTIIYAPEASKR